MPSITVPKSVTSIGKGAFDACTSLKDIYFNGKKAKWDKLTKDVSFPENATIHFKRLFGYTK